MNREQVIAALREHEAELRPAGVAHLSLFGSTVRGDRGTDSDIDLLAAFDEARRISLLDVAGIEIPELDDGLVNRDSKVTVRAGEASWADLRAIPRAY